MAPCVNALDVPAMTEALRKQRNAAIDSSETWMLGARFQRLIVASFEAFPAVDSACGPGLIMRFSWDKVAEAHAGNGVLMVGLNVV